MNARKRVALFLAAFLTFTLIGAGLHERANAVCLASNPDDTCWFGASASAKHFRDGYFHRAHGIKFAHPRRVRSVFIVKIEHRLANHPALKRRVLRHQGIIAKDPCTTNYCTASRAWSEVVTRASCVGTGYPTTSKATCDAVPPATNDEGFLGDMTKKGIFRAGTFIFCGGAVVIGVIGAVGSDGVASPAVTAIWGGTGCGWGLWGSLIE